jgi:hypothetical protein
MLENNPAWSGRVRYLCVNGSSGIGSSGTAITASNLLNAYLTALTTTVAGQLFNAFRLRAVEVWCPTNVTSGTGSPSTVAVQYNSGTGIIGASGQNFSDTSVGVEPAHVYAPTKRGSVAGDWQAGTGTPMFTITCPIGSIVDIHIDYKNVLGAVGGTLSIASGFALPSACYFGSLDGIAKASSNFPSVQNNLAV